MLSKARTQADLVSGPDCIIRNEFSTLDANQSKTSVYFPQEEIWARSIRLIKGSTCEMAASESLARPSPKGRVSELSQGGDGAKLQ